MLVFGCVLRGWVCWLRVACHAGITTRAALRTSEQPAFFFGSLATRREAGSSDLEEAARIHPTRKFIRPFLDHFIRPILDRLFDRFSAVLSDRSSTVYSTVSRPFYSTVLFDRLPTVHLFDRFLRSQVFTDLAPAPSSTRPTAQRLPNKDQPRRHCSYAPPPQPPPPPWPHATHTTHTPADTRPAAPSCRPPRGAGFWRGGWEGGGEKLGDCVLLRDRRKVLLLLLLLRRRRQRRLQRRRGRRRPHHNVCSLRRMKDAAASQDPAGEARAPPRRPNKNRIKIYVPCGE